MTVLRTTYSLVLHLVHRQDFDSSDFRTPKIRVEIWRVTVATATQRLPSFFLFSWILLSSSYLVPTYIRYLKRKTVVEMKIGQFEGGLIFHTDLKHTCATLNFRVAHLGRGQTGNRTLRGKTNGKLVNFGVWNSEWHKEPLACGQCLKPEVKAKPSEKGFHLRASKDLLDINPLSPPL